MLIADKVLPSLVHGRYKINDAQLPQMHEEERISRHTSWFSFLFESILSLMAVILASISSCTAFWPLIWQIYRITIHENYYDILRISGHKQSTGLINNRWKILVNAT